MHHLGGIDRNLQFPPPRKRFRNVQDVVPLLRLAVAFSKNELLYVDRALHLPKGLSTPDGRHVILRLIVVLGLVFAPNLVYRVAPKVCNHNYCAISLRYRGVQCVQLSTVVQGTSASFFLILFGFAFILMKIALLWLAEASLGSVRHQLFTARKSCVSTSMLV